MCYFDLISFPAPLLLLLLPQKNWLSKLVHSPTLFFFLPATNEMWILMYHLFFWVGLCLHDLATSSHHNVPRKSIYLNIVTYVQYVYCNTCIWYLENRWLCIFYFGSEWTYTWDMPCKQHTGTESSAFYSLCLYLPHPILFCWRKNITTIYNQIMISDECKNPSQDDGICEWILSVFFLWLHWCPAMLYLYCNIFEFPIILDKDSFSSSGTGQSGLSKGTSIGTQLHLIKCAPKLWKERKTAIRSWCDESFWKLSAKKIIQNTQNMDLFYSLCSHFPKKTIKSIK